MGLSEEQIDRIISKFMPKVKEDSISAMKEVLCLGSSISSAASKHQVTHQSLSKNLLHLKRNIVNICSCFDIIPSSELFEQIAQTLFFAEEEYQSAITALTTYCNALSGNVEHLTCRDETIFHFGDKSINVFKNPDTSFEREWSLDVSIYSS